MVLADTATLTGRTCPCLSRSKYSPFFIASDGFSGVQLWRSDGTAAGTVPVKVWPEAGWFALAAEEVKGIHSSSRPMRDLLVVTHGCHESHPQRNCGHLCGVRSQLISSRTESRSSSFAC